MTRTQEECGQTESGSPSNDSTFQEIHLDKLPEATRVVVVRRLCVSECLRGQKEMYKYLHPVLKPERFSRAIQFTAGCKET